MRLPSWIRLSRKIFSPGYPWVLSRALSEPWASEWWGGICDPSGFHVLNATPHSPPPPEVSLESESEGETQWERRIGIMAHRTPFLCPSIGSPSIAPSRLGQTPRGEGGWFLSLSSAQSLTSRACPKSQWVGGPENLSIALASICLRSSRRVSLRRTKTETSPKAHRLRWERLRESKTMAGVAVAQVSVCLLLPSSSLILWAQAPCQLPLQPRPAIRDSPGWAELHRAETTVPKFTDDRGDSLADFYQNSNEN